MYRVDMSTAAENADVPADLASVFVKKNEPVLTASDVAEELDITQQGAHAKLQRAQQRGAVKKKTVGARAVVWWIPDLTV